MDADLPLVFGGLLAVALWLYTLTAGADFGGGVWEFVARGPRAGAQRTLIAHAIGPIWEADHVWMILVVVLLFVAFPLGFSAIMTALHVPIVAMLVGLTLRGAAFVFRSYAPRRGGWARWGLVFASSSAVTPLLLGVILGAVVSGALRLGPDGVVRTDFVSEWWAPFPWALGAMFLALCAYLAAVYLAVEASEPALQRDFCLRAMGANVAFGATALVAGLTARAGAPHLFEVLAGSPTAWAMQALTALVAAASLGALATGRARLARLLAGAQVTLVYGAFVAAMGRWLLPGALTLEAAAAPASILRPVLGALAVGAVVLVPSFVWLFSVFKRR